jgi:hypothetical protein
MITLALCNPGDEAVTVITPGEYDLMVILAIPYRIHRVSGEVALLKDTVCIRDLSRKLAIVHTVVSNDEGIRS